MTPQRQQTLLLTTILFGSLLIGIVTYRAAPPVTTVAPGAEADIAQPETTPAVAAPPADPRPVSVKKNQFFDRLIPLVERQNNLTLQSRAAVLKMLAHLQQGKKLTTSQRRQLERLRKKYRVRTDSDDERTLINELLARVDVLPPSLALAQAATESAWGKSRFARKGNNLFGQWCFTSGCGLVPLQRPEGMSHEVASYPSWQASVTAYFLNLNSHPAYQPLRDMRLQLRQQSLPLSGEILAAGLKKYSARGAAYVKSLRQIIRANNLASLDQLLLTTKVRSARNYSAGHRPSAPGINQGWENQ